MSEKILCIETSTHNCSVAVFNGDQLLSCVEGSSDQYIHGESLHLFIEQALKNADMKSADLTAIGISKGPGSYTGLRIGVSAAKGLAYALDIPIYSLESLEVLALAALDSSSREEAVLSLIDARRMEVYAAMFSIDGKKETPTKAIVVESDSFEEWRQGRKVLLVGDAQEKLKEVLDPNVFSYSEKIFPSAKDMGGAILLRIKEGMAEDLAYFEPYYLKDFVAGTPRRSPLNL